MFDLIDLQVVGGRVGSSTGIELLSHFGLRVGFFLCLRLVGFDVCSSLIFDLLDLADLFGVLR